MKRATLPMRLGGLAILPMGWTYCSSVIHNQSFHIFIQVTMSMELHWAFGHINSIQLALVWVGRRSLWLTHFESVGLFFPWGQLGRLFIPWRTGLELVYQDNRKNSPPDSICVNLHDPNMACCNESMWPNNRNSILMATWIISYDHESPNCNRRVILPMIHISLTRPRKASSL